MILTIRIAFLKFEIIANKKQLKNTHSKRDCLMTKIFPCSGGALRSLGRANIETKYKYLYYKKFEPMDERKNITKYSVKH